MSEFRGEAWAWALAERMYQRIASGHGFHRRSLYKCICVNFVLFALHSVRREREPASGDTLGYVCSVANQSRSRWYACRIKQSWTLRATGNYSNWWIRMNNEPHAAKSEELANRKSSRLFFCLSFVVVANRRLMTEMVITLAGDAHSIRLNVIPTWTMNGFRMSLSLDNSRSIWMRRTRCRESFGAWAGNRGKFQIHFEDVLNGIRFFYETLLQTWEQIHSRPRFFFHEITLKNYSNKSTTVYHKNVFSRVRRTGNQSAQLYAPRTRSHMSFFAFISFLI